MKKGIEEIQEALSEIFGLTDEERAELEQNIEWELEFEEFYLEDLKENFKTYKPKKLDE